MPPRSNRSPLSEKGLLAPDSGVVTIIDLQPQVLFGNNRLGVASAIDAGGGAQNFPDHDIESLASLLTMVGGRIVHGDDEFAALAPPLPPAMSDWSPLRRDMRPATTAMPLHSSRCARHAYERADTHARVAQVPVDPAHARSFRGALGCGCFAF
jgi:hypothetical protein